jgi:curved DNA-binding protein CbpA
MAQPLDPYRTLGLAPGATPEEIRRAYRRLAKANHPDSAGEAALPRFLAIQAAYEMLVAGHRPRSAAGRRASSSAPPPPAEPWHADPARARATRQGSGRRRTAGTAGTAGAAGASSGPRPRTSGPSERPRRPGGASGRTREPNKATLGSTSYDAAEDEPFEPEWSGGTWYGASSGTYWTINPKEYADPRKHGPEYQRRARRRLDGLEPDAPEAPDAHDDGSSLGGTDFADAGSTSESEAAGRAGFDGRWAYPEDEAEAGHWDWTGDTDGRWTGAAEHEEDVARPPWSAVARDFLAGRVGFTGRFVLAFVAWLPIGAFIAWLAGELSGCGRFTASCVDGSWASLIVQLVAYAILVALPPLAAISAAGTIGSLALSVPAAVILSAGGGSRQPEASAVIITVTFFVGYTAGVAFALGRRLGWRRVP